MLGFHWLAVRKVKGSGERPQLFPSTGAKKVLVFTICPVLRLFHNLRLSRHGHEHMSQHSVGLKWPQNGPGRQTVGRKVLLLGGGHMKTRGEMVTDCCIAWLSYAVDHGQFEVHLLYDIIDMNVPR